VFIHAETYRVTRKLRALTVRHGTVTLETLDPKGDDPAQLWVVYDTGHIRSETRDKLYLSPSNCLAVGLAVDRPEAPWSIVPVGDHSMKVRLVARECDRQRALRASFASFSVSLDDEGFEFDAAAWYIVPESTIAGLVT
jgi:hypothetical protein